MIRKITYSSVKYVNLLGKDKNKVVISILDNSGKYTRPDLSKFQDSLLLNFKDRCEEDFAEYDFWPDNPCPLFTSYYVFENERLVSLSDAEKIMKFFFKHHDDKEEKELLVHCRSGVSRSAAVALYLGNVFSIPWESSKEHNRFNPNLRVIRLLDKVMKTKYCYAYNRSIRDKLYKLDFSPGADSA